MLDLYRMNTPVLSVISHPCSKRANSTRNENRTRRVIAFTLTYSRSMNRMPVVSSLIPSAYSCFFFRDRMLRRRDVRYHREAKVELGEEIAARLKLTKDGTKVLWPQPTDSEKDPQNWTGGRKDIQLLIITLAAFVPDFDSGIGKQFQMTRETGLEWLSSLQVLRPCSHWLNNTIRHPVLSIT